MDGIQGAVLEIKLRNIDKASEGRRLNADRYNERLSGVDGIILPEEGENQRHVYHIYPIRVQDRDTVLANMGEAGVACGIHYPVPLHLQEAYSNLGYSKGSFPISEQSASEFLSLPMFPELTQEQVDLVCAVLKDQLTKQNELIGNS